MEKFERAFSYTLTNEGGFTIDIGGPTMYGIVEDDYQAFYGSRPTTDQMRALTTDQARAIYRKLYFDPMKLSQVIADSVSTALFDMGVNMGIHTGVKIAQRSLSDLGTHLTTDGLIGPMTIAALNACAPDIFIRQFVRNIIGRYEQIVVDVPSDGIYLKGWLARANRLLTLI